MSRVFWDTNLFIYLVEGKGAHMKSVIRLAERMDERGDQLITSALTLGELLVHPVAQGDDEMAQRYENVLRSRATVVSFDEGAGRHYAQVRQDKTIKGVDAMQLACAANARTDLFITNDARLAGKVIPGIQFVVSLSNALI
jgi:uncharacterized protein